MHSKVSWWLACSWFAHRISLSHYTTWLTSASCSAHHWAHVQFRSADVEVLLRLNHERPFGLQRRWSSSETSAGTMGTLVSMAKQTVTVMASLPPDGASSLVDKAKTVQKTGTDETAQTDKYTDKAARHNDLGQRPKPKRNYLWQRKTIRGKVTGHVSHSKAEKLTLSIVLNIIKWSVTVMQLFWVEWQRLDGAFQGSELIKWHAARGRLHDWSCD